MKPKHPKPKKRRKMAPGPKPTPGTAIVPIAAPANLAVVERAIEKSAVPSVLKTVQSLEAVRRFVSKCLNQDLQRRQSKLKPGEKLPEAEKKRLEIDWGTIPGVDKPFLLQPGAEKFCFWLNIRPKYLNREIDLGGGHLEIVSQVRFLSKTSGEEVFEGPECSCTTMEDNYRFRFQERDANKPQPSPLERDELKALGMGKSKKKTEWVKGKPAGEKWVWLDRVENSNIWNERNKVRQIGEKRALVKGVRNMGAMSEIFVTNPEEWNIPEDIDEGPDVDASYTEGGRKIVPSDPAPKSEGAWDKREKENLDKLTPEQRQVLERKMRDGAQQPVASTGGAQSGGLSADSPGISKSGSSSAPAPEPPKPDSPTPQPGKEGAAAAGCPPAAPEIIYTWSDPQQLARIEPAANLTTDVKRLLLKFYKAPEGACILNGEDFEGLKFELEKRGIALRRKS